MQSTYRDGCGARSNGLNLSAVDSRGGVWHNGGGNWDSSRDNGSAVSWASDSRSAASDGLGLSGELSNGRAGGSSASSGSGIIAGQDEGKVDALRVVGATDLAEVGAGLSVGVEGSGNTASNSVAPCQAVLEAWVLDNSLALLEGVLGADNGTNVVAVALNHVRPSVPVGVSLLIKVWAEQVHSGSGGRSGGCVGWAHTGSTWHGARWVHTSAVACRVAWETSGCHGAGAGGSAWDLLGELDASSRGSASDGAKQLALLSVGVEGGCHASIAEGRAGGQAVRERSWASGSLLGGVTSCVVVEEDADGVLVAGNAVLDVEAILGGLAVQLRAELVRLRSGSSDRQTARAGWDHRDGRIRVGVSRRAGSTWKGRNGTAVGEDCCRSRESHGLGHYGC